MLNKGDVLIARKRQPGFIFTHTPAAAPGKNDRGDIIEHSKCITFSEKMPFCACCSWEYTAGDFDRPGSWHALSDTCVPGRQSR